MPFQKIFTQFVGWENITECSGSDSVPGDPEVQAPSLHFAGGLSLPPWDKALEHWEQEDIKTISLLLAGISLCFGAVCEILTLLVLQVFQEIGNQ